MVKAAKHLAYVPNLTARSLRTRRTHALGLLLSDLADPDHAQVGAGFEQRAGDLGYTVLVMATRKRLEDAARAIQVLHERSTDGICIASSSLDPAEARELVAPTPLVVIQPDHPMLPSQVDQMPAGAIRSDDVAGAGLAVRHLLSLGIRDIAYLGVAAHASNQVRMTAVRNELQTQIGRQLRVFEVSDEAWRTPTRVAEAIDRPLPDAIICYDDKLAIALLDGLRSIGARVPQDVAVVGYDGIPFAAFSNPRLTTVAMPSLGMGSRAAEMLIGAIETGGLPAAETFPVELVVRESTTAPRVRIPEPMPPLEPPA